MKPQALKWLACPICGGNLSSAIEESDDLVEGDLSCANGHTFPIVRGVPRLLPSQQMSSAEASKSIRESFSREWSHYDYEADRTWGQTVEERRADFLRHIDRPPDFLAGKVVLDAGCGNGALSVQMSTFGCDVVATDISESVESAYHHFNGAEPGATHFIQSDLMNPALRREAFDVIYCAGVLHHTPDTRATFEALIPALAPGGTVFVWLYWREPGLRAGLTEIARKALSPMPAPVKHGAVWLLLPQSLIRNRIRLARGRTEEKLNARETLVRMLDSYTPRYRWLHSPEELSDWYKQHGFSDITVTERGTHGFGVAARKPTTAG